jgi:Carboxypeptidase regulatory-like domain
MFNRVVALFAGLTLLVPLHAQYQIIELEKVQLARSLAGVVTDMTGTRMADVLVEEFSSDWNRSLRATKTDAKGRFSFSPVKGRDIYFLQLRLNGFDPLRVRVKIDRNQGKNLRLKLEIAT